MHKNARTPCTPEVNAMGAIFLQVPFFYTARTDPNGNMIGARDVRISHGLSVTDAMGRSLGMIAGDAVYDPKTDSITVNLKLHRQSIFAPSKFTFR
jgi:hypothetical protein